MTSKRVFATFLAMGVALAAGCRSEKPRAGHEEEAHHEEEEGHRGDAHEGHGGTTIELTPEQTATAQIATAKVERRKEAGLLRTTAQIEAAADRQARVGSRIGGRITALKAGVGDRVKKGALLATIDSPEVGQAKADYLSALAASQVASQTLERERALYEKKITSEREFREAEAASIKARAEKESAENRLHALGVSDSDLPKKVEGHYDSTLAITAPIDGVLVERNATLGQNIESTDTLFVVMDLEEVWVLVDVYERDLSQVKIGQRGRARVAAHPDRDFIGTVENIGAVVESKTRAVKVRLVLPNPKGELKPGMFATVLLEETTGDARERLFVPSEAIQRDGVESLVFVPRGDHRFEVRRVQLGEVADTWTAIEDGISEGEAVVTTGSFALKSQLKKEELGGGHEH